MLREKKKDVKEYVFSPHTTNRVHEFFVGWKKLTCESSNDTLYSLVCTYAGERSFKINLAKLSNFFCKKKEKITF